MIVKKKMLIKVIIKKIINQKSSNLIGNWKEKLQRHKKITISNQVLKNEFESLKNRNFDKK